MAMTFGVDADRLSRSRFVVSRLVELTNGLEVLTHPDRAPSARRWVDRSRRALDRDRVAVVVALVETASWYVPDFLVPLPRRYQPTLEEELAAVATTPPAEIRRQLELAFRLGPPPTTALARSRARAGRDPRAPLPTPVREVLAEGGEAALAIRVADDLARCWQETLADWWPVIQRTLDEDVRHHATQASRVGFAELVDNLDHRLHWNGREVSVDLPYDLRVEPAEALILAPSIFLPRPAVWLGRESEVMIGYPARGRAALWATPTPPNGEAELLGHTRAALLADLGVPRSTTELATRHNLSPGTISYHLTRLHQAGLVARRQHGHSVLYTHTPRATELLMAFE